LIYGDTESCRAARHDGFALLQIGGAAVNQAAVDVVEKAKDLAADLFEADRGDVVLDKASGSFHVVGSPALSHSWADLAKAAVAKDGNPLFAEVDLASPGPTFPFGTHISVVEVDTETGKVTLLRHIAVDDAGRIVNPLLAEGQVHGGIAQGVAQALLEEVVYDLDGTPSPRHSPTTHSSPRRSCRATKRASPRRRHRSTRWAPRELESPERSGRRPPCTTRSVTRWRTWVFARGHADDADTRLERDQRAASGNANGKG